ncbi:hypothetical protein HYV31_00905 [candidate division WWE3 bacterium]|nr:hypothetical protein [candidate division WWE3 bacterium]
MQNFPIELNGVIPVWQEMGNSTNIIAKKLAQKLGVLTSHTGTLDPMASGVVIVLSGEVRKEKYELARWKKTYEFEVVFGIATDTFDGLGLITNVDKKIFENNFLQNINLNKLHLQNFIKNLEQSLPEFIGEYTQTVPVYSSVKFKGKPLHYHARNTFIEKDHNVDNIILPTKSGQIFALKILKSSTQTLQKIISKIIFNINLVKGDFRQDEIIESWNKFLVKCENKNIKLELPVVRFKVEMTKGLYVRSLATDIAQKLNTYGFVYDLTRTKNGKYSKKDCLTLELLKLTL